MTIRYMKDADRPIAVAGLPGGGFEVSRVGFGWTA